MARKSSPMIYRTRRPNPHTGGRLSIATTEKKTASPNAGLNEHCLSSQLCGSMSSRPSCFCVAVRIASSERTRSTKQFCRLSSRQEPVIERTFDRLKRMAVHVAVYRRIRRTHRNLHIALAPLPPVPTRSRLLRHGFSIYVECFMREPD